MNWYPAQVKPEPYHMALLAIIGGDYTTGHYAAQIDKWIGFAGNQSPPYYEIQDGFVTHWCSIDPVPAPGAVDGKDFHESRN